MRYIAKFSTIANFLYALFDKIIKLKYKIYI